MSYIRRELVAASINRANVSIDYNIYDNIHKIHEFKKQTILADNFLTNDEKTYAIKDLNKTYDKNKINYNSGTRRICETCNQECLATLYCEYCVQNYLKANFSNWTSGNNDIDNLIQKCQIEALHPQMIIEWIPYNNLQNIKYLTKGGFSEIYTTVWIDGGYTEWDSKEQKLIRFGRQKVILKGLENVENANQRWFEEAESHLKISNKSPVIVQCYGLTQNPSNGNYMLVIEKADIDLRKYLQQTQNQLTWKERIKVAYDIIVALSVIHRENAIHRDLHSGNILYSELYQQWFISDLGFCGPADKSSESIYGNLPYIAPEVISGKKTTIKSDIYSIGMLMWEISSGQPPFSYYENYYNLALNIINGMRPKVISGTPLKYENLMKQCWDADPLKRPEIGTLFDGIYEILQFYQNISNEILQQETNKNLERNKLINNSMSKHVSSKLFTSNIHQFKNLPEPRNATEEEQEAFHSKSYDCFNIPDNIEDFNNSSNQNYAGASNLKDDSEELSKSFNELQINSNEDNQINYGKEIVEQQQIKQYNLNIDDDDETYDDKNFHSEEEDVFEIPDGKII
ncbi:kinase-like domain-containing protein [Rhizophagus irregularis DAOM 181602=DAOM 197198]|uniref:Kinase-like domain-containing protein n=1 Tax=Rhizophagus irregularis (strain DAOM 181602 / DAOM 197198 / MUCL 43194) TaxID=747089 RepID=A0A2P4Q8Z6_RHIID|nr:kinase-like domain-containing protein [Rhizophagus irregularis DAOM 181602=DAOM 197198]POG74114.1 kinase-like domain-containing protein [Rhizophagus irregularis DAOM 181602=DAOM 197198]|eukprot:XP_025180980.1 kinase-like domain-containing protein [Rhizophagus irregularis DAOM 181602=DAOM 197198]